MRCITRRVIFPLPHALFAVVSIASAQPRPPRLELSADSNWKFVLGDPSGAEAPSFDDTDWRNINLPHDWSIEGRPSRENPTGPAGGFFPAGTGWYRKTFNAHAEWKGKLVAIEFDGVHRDATVYLNGRKLGFHPYGYTSFRFDLTPELDFAGPNVLAVRVDNSAQPNSRWYTGSGIYRHVRVVVTHPVHVAHWGVFVTTKQAADGNATVSVRTRVANESSAPAGVSIETRIVDRSGKPLGRAQSTFKISAGGEAEAGQEISATKPALWSPEARVLYRALTRILKGGVLVDEVETPFGIRTLAWSAEKGILLNGKPVKLAGGSVHHDNGPLGAAAFDRAEERKAELLKAAGFNAVRAAHNPPSPAFLDACDRVGLLVIDEAFDTWRAPKVRFDYGRNFDEWSRQDLGSMVLRDRNHPSVIAWSIGNEIPEATVERGPAMAKQLASLVRSFDASRPVTQAFPTSTSGPNPDAVISNLDIVGYNYNLATHHVNDHQRIPSRVMMTSESFPNAVFNEWRLTQDNPYIVGEFLWTAMDYLGESGIGSWSYGTPAQAAAAAKGMGDLTTIVDRLFQAIANGADMTAMLTQGTAQSGVSTGAVSWHAAVCGDIDLTGHRRPQSYYRDILWNGGDRVYATVRLPEPEGKKIVAGGWSVFPTMAAWAWPGHEGKTMQVEVYSGAESVRLFLNDKLVGEKPTTREHQFKAVFDVLYTPGVVKAVGVKGGRVVAESVLTTAGPPARLRLTADRPMVHADGQDLSFVAVEAVDREGRLQPNADLEVEFSLSGPGAIAAVGNGDGQDNSPYQGSRRKLFQGRALVVVRTSTQAGPIRLTGTASGSVSGAVTVDARAAILRKSV